MKIEEFFFELLQVAIDNRKELSHTPSADEWKELFALSKKQALTAIAFAGVNKLRKAGADGDGFGAGIGIDEVAYLKWLGLTAKVAQRNKVLNKICVSLCKELAHDGLACCILKGQSNLDYYPDSLKDCRTAGDIDIWCTTADPYGIEIAVSDLNGKGAHYERYKGIEGVIEYAFLRARIAGIPKPTVNYYHTDLEDVWSVGVEIHHRPSFLNSPHRNRRLQRWFQDNEQFNVCTSSGGFSVPTVSFNAVYQLLHIFKHLLDEGVGLRQLLDYYFVLRMLHIEQGTMSDCGQSMAQWAEGMGIGVKSNVEIMHTLSSIGMARFAASVMYVLKEVFAMPDEYLLCKPDVKAGKFLLEEIMLAGSFGKYDDRVVRGKHNAANVLVKFRRNMKFIKYYPEEVLCEPLFRIYHHFWRKWELWMW